MNIHQKTNVVNWLSMLGTLLAFVLICKGAE